MANDEPKPDVLSSLPRTRPQRRSSKRDAPRTGAKKTASPAAAKSVKAKAKPKATPKPGPKAKPKTAPRSIPAAGFAAPVDGATRPAPGAAELISTAIQAAGELAQIGLAVGGQALRSALGRRSGD